MTEEAKRFVHGSLLCQAKSAVNSECFILSSGFFRMNDEDYVVTTGLYENTSLWKWCDGDLSFQKNIFTNDLLIYGVNFFADKTAFVANSHHTVYKFNDDQTLSRVHEEGELVWTITAVAISADGTLIAVGHRDGSIDVLGLRLNTSVSCHFLNSAVRALAFSPDGRRISAGLANGCVLFIDAESLKLERRLYAHGKRIWSVKFTHDSRLLFTGSNDCTVKMHDCSSQPHSICTFEHQGPVSCLELTCDGKRLLSGGMNNYVSIWDVDDRRLIHILQDLTRPVSSVCLSEGTSNLLLTSSEEGTIMIYDFAKLTRLFC